jgi:hypothetical protein
VGDSKAAIIFKQTMMLGRRMKAERIMNTKQTTSICLAVLFGACIFTTLSANPIAPQWRLLNNSAPARYAHICAFDRIRNVVVLFGGKDSLDEMPSDTWELSGYSNNWNHFQVSGPGGRIGHGMWFDKVDSMVFLFGGLNQAGQFLNDTWAWNGGSWTIVDSTGPAPRSYFVLSYDDYRNRTVLFSGIGPDSLYRDTWEWDGSHWIQMATTGPPPRIMSAMANDGYLFGGQAGYNGEVYNDTWKWNGAVWVQVPNISDPLSPRVGHVMEFAIAGGPEVEVFGGQDSFAGNSIYGDHGFFYLATDTAYWYTYSIGDGLTARTEAATCSYGRHEFAIIGGRDSSHIFTEVWTYPVFFHYMIGDINGSYSFTGLDVTYAVRYFKSGISLPPWYYFECTSGNTWFLAGDVNGSCSFSGLDITYMVRYFKGGSPPIPCPICPPFD